MKKDWEKKKRDEILNYQKNRHYKLLNQEGSGLSDELKSRLRTYSVILIDQLNWEIRDQYIELLDKFMEKKIDLLKFRIAFLDRYQSIEKVADVLESNRVLLSPDENSLDFGDLLSKIESCCQAYSNDPEPFRNKFEIEDVEFRTLIEKIYFQMAKYSDK